MTDNKSVFKLHEIAQWQENSFVELPKVQRGFVWKPYQIEDLWDSLIRKYPVGAFVFNKHSNNTLELLDGQQRATAITLGFNNKTFRGSENHFKLFIDLELPVNDHRKYYIRVITDSHPWGYQKKPNNKPLEAQQKREAIKCWDEVDLINPDLHKCFPYDAALPVPLHFFLDAAIENKHESTVIDTIFNWPLYTKVIDKIRNYLELNSRRGDQHKELQKLSSDENYIKERICHIYDDIKKMFIHHEIPALYLENVLGAETNTGSVTLSQNNENEELEHEVENLFVRLNSGGTPLRGEELNYSILKTKIKQETQRKIESECENFIAPARFITVAFRLHQFIGATASVRDGIGMNIKPRQFQIRLKESKASEGFENFILHLLDDTLYDGKTLINYTRQILEYCPPQNKQGFPHLVARKIVNNSPELLFLLWYRLLIKRDLFSFRSKADKELHQKMLGILSIFLWFGKSDGNRDYSKLLNNVWPAMKALDKKVFWSSATVKRAMQNDVLLPIPPFTKNAVKNPSIQWFSKQNPTLKTDLFDKFYKVSPAYFNTQTLFFNSDLVLYAQRDFLYIIFHNKQFHLDDTNVPFDWDHIYPNKLITGKKNVPRLLKDFYNSIGNFRAWPYELNRMDSDDTPQKKFNPLANVESSEELNKSWQDIINKYPKLIRNTNQLSEKLLKWSVCDPEWTQSDITDIKKYGKDVFKLIVKRAIDIIESWYKELRIEELIPEFKKKSTLFMQEVFSQNKVDTNPKWLNKEDWGMNEFINMIIKRPIEVNGTKLFLYLSFSKDPESLLKEENIFFGFYEKEESGFMQTVKVAQDASFNYNKNEYYFESLFTLVSEHEQSRKLLFSDIVKWIDHKQFPLKNKRKEIKQVLADALKKKYKPIVA